MILSHKHRFIFFAVPKTGTHAVRFALREHLGETDEEQVQLFVQKVLSYPDIAQLRTGHIRWDEISEVLPQDVWDGYFKFAFVRNPWERFVSYCAFMYRTTDAFSRDPRGLMRRVLTEPGHRQRVVFQPQHRFICDADGGLKVDFVGRHETMQASYDTIADRIGLPRRELEQKNASIHGPWRDYYDAELTRRVAELYARDIDLFEYTFS